MVEKGSFQSLLIRFFETFKSSNSGQILFKRIRYKKYKPVYLSDKEWQEVLGSDINTLLHNLNIYNITLEFLDEYSKENECDLNEHEKDLLFLAAIIHNWGEASGPEIPCDLKTIEDERKEISNLKDITLTLSMIFCKHHFHEIELHKKCTEAIDKIITNKKSRLGQIFQAIEHIAYFEVAMTAWKKSLETQKLSKNLRWIVVNTWCKNFIRLMEFSKKYPHIKKIIKKHEASIDASFNVSLFVFDLFEGLSESKFFEFAKAKRYWQENKEQL